MRYKYLEEMCVEHQITKLFFAHHEDDQAETLLLQLLRGSGIAGLAAMPTQKIIGVHGTTVHRPFLRTSRAELEEYAKFHQLSWIEDPSNQDERYTRNFIRHQITPLFEQIQPQFRSNLGRSAMHFSRAQRLLDQLADIDLEELQKSNNNTVELSEESITPESTFPRNITLKHGLNISVLLALFAKDIDRANNALRRWLALQDLLMPSEERLNAWWRDLQNLKDYQDQSLAWQHDGKILRIWQDQLCVTDDQRGGQWYFQRVRENSTEWGLEDAMYQQAMQNQLVHVRVRSGGEKIRISPNSPRKTLKNIFQEAGIPSWQRNAPLLYLGEEILAVAGVGMNCDVCVNEGVRWLAYFEHEVNHQPLQN
jgi:tRNA(Ile)-lysidine synthase